MHYPEQHDHRLRVEGDVRRLYGGWANRGGGGTTTVVVPQKVLQGYIKSGDFKNFGRTTWQVHDSYENAANIRPDHGKALSGAAYR